MKTNGTLLLSGSYWLIAADPDVLMRLKRWIPRADGKAIGQLRIRSSPEVCADLEAFLERFPLDADPAHRLRLHAGAEDFRRCRSRVGAILDGSYTPRNFDLAVPLRDYQRVAVELGLAVKRFLLGDAMGVGKGGRPCDRILTPTGWTTYGAIRTGDAVIGSDGRAHHVTGVYRRGVLDVFRVTMNDGSSTVCDGDHLWAVCTPSQKHRGGGWRVLPTREVAATLRDGAGNLRHHIPMVKPVEFAAAAPPVDAYLLGYLIGNGCMASPMAVSVSTPDPETIERLRPLLPPGSTFAPSRNRIDYRIRGTALRNQLAEIGLMGKKSPEKSIPHSYLFGRLADRIALLQGLLDSDGYVSSGSMIEYTTSSGALADDVTMLVQSLGGVCRRGIKLAPAYTHNGERRIGLPSHRLNIAVPAAVAPFRLSRKAAAYQPRPKYKPARLIERVDPIGQDEVICISVDASDSLYVADGCIVTHNTLSAIGMLKGGGFFPALVVCPKQVANQWANEVLPWALPGVRTHILEGTRPYDIAQRAGQAELFAGRRSNNRSLPDVLVTTYERLSAWASTLAPDGREPLVRAMVLDECVALRHRDTDKYRAAAHISERVDAVFGLDGYPIANYGAEIGNILDVIRPGCLGNEEEFTREWCTTTDEARKRRIRDPVAFGLRLRTEGLLLRRTAHEVGRELPPISIVRVPLDGDRSKLDAIRGRAGELARTILAQGADPLAKGRAFRDLDRIARQATGIAKAPAAAEFVRGLVERGERVVVAAWHREVHTILAEQLKDYAPAFYTGDETDKQKAEALRRFKSKETPILVLSLRSGSGIDGLQYTDCRVVVEVELDWAPNVHDQLRARVARDGQPDPVTVYTLVIDDGSDPVVADVICAKRGNSAPVIDPSKPAAEIPEADRAAMLARAMRGTK